MWTALSNSAINFLYIYSARIRNFTDASALVRRKILRCRGFSCLPVSPLELFGSEFRYANRLQMWLFFTRQLYLKQTCLSSAHRSFHKKFYTSR